MSALRRLTRDFPWASDRLIKLMLKLWGEGQVSKALASRQHYECVLEELVDDVKHLVERLDRLED